MKPSNERSHFAFPVFDHKGECLPGGAGLATRQYFAAMAMQGIMANSEIHPSTDYETVAKRAVKMTDALLAELEK
jgi:hypothetical protein